MGIKNKINRYFLKGHERTVLAKKNIAYSLLIKGFSVFISLLIIPLSIRYINSTQYGIWLTLSSIVGWMSFFDLGLGNGLRNKLAEATALKKAELSRILISTTYAILSIIAGIFLLLFLVINQFVDWKKILNTHAAGFNFNFLAMLVFGIFCIQFVVQTINTVLTASHQVAKVSVISFLGQGFTLVAVFLILRFTHSSLVLLVLVNGLAPLLIQIIASIWYYHHELENLSPGFKFIDFKFARELLSLGGVFFVIQLGALVLFQTDNIVITQLFGPAQVTTFNVAYKLFSVLIFGFNIVMAPFWSAFTDAYAKHDMQWIKSMMTKIKYFWLVTSGGGILLFFIAPYIYPLWLHNSVSVPTSLSFAMAFYIIVYTWQTAHVYLLNGINKIRLQLILVLVSAALNIPLAIFLGHKIGLAGITWANSVLFLIMGMIFSYQTKRILNSSAKGILNA